MLAKRHSAKCLAILLYQNDGLKLARIQSSLYKRNFFKEIVEGGKKLCLAKGQEANDVLSCIFVKNSKSLLRPRAKLILVQRIYTYGCLKRHKILAKVSRLVIGHKIGIF